MKLSREQMRAAMKRGATAAIARIKARDDEVHAQCAAWNSKHAVGAEVTVQLDSGERRRTKTRSEAYVADSGYAVIFLEGVTGYYLLERVTA